jgi:alpha-tubulin suppressor-like RCC1 family protein
MSQRLFRRAPLLSVLAFAVMAACSEDRLPTEPDLKSAGPAPLLVDPSAFELLVPGFGVATLTAKVQFVGPITATSSDQTCTVVTPASVPATKPPGSSLYVASFTVTAVAAGTCTITVRDKKGRQVAVPVHVGTNVVTTPRGTIAARWDHLCGLATDARAYCWGKNDHGQLGDGSTTDRNIPTLVSNVPAFRDIVVGVNHTCGLAADGSAYCWGDNFSGQLGNGSTTASLAAVRVSGSNRFVSLVSGNHHVCGLTGAGAAWCWGANFDGELGDGSTTNRSAPVAVGGGLAFATLTAGEFHTCGTTTIGQSYCWGGNITGELGDGTTEARSTPTAIAGGLTFTSLAGGRFHTCGLTASGAAYCWGNNGSGEVGIGVRGTRLTPQAVVSPVGGTALTFLSLATGDANTCGRVSGGGTYCWGSNGAGTVGDGTSGTDRYEPTAVSGSPTYAALAAGVFVSCGVRSDGAAFCWGINEVGQLGNGVTGPNQLSPVAVAGGVVFATP